MVRGTLKKSYEIYRAIQDPVARAYFILFTRKALKYRKKSEYFSLNCIEFHEKKHCHQYIVIAAPSAKCNWTPAKDYVAGKVYKVANKPLATITAAQAMPR